ncbi:sugar O-acyltransferase (sialic acid O-acetyltransferase NeuD family) [Chryseobacterium bernardetii]|uniref:Sugar O-acyltransferase (Sialic acid O-acetyltransferase NeuD family) n=2 Tax=Chryseobacterium TaxID=59732 RepID=A0A543ECH1_9FLAO|nr:MULTISPECIES: acetyltransferase [Chryseobacterium]MDR6372560.1 sugar O-acyltransferase (sialic acid O-acetyltransferase NeuD family) [Chryseobacterium vietnamense]MDR6442778.1 sugar O-acyltransferase (sialic acid O-acetyltransferase NeuD family) [Chryseobacterium bernardetii]TQM19246.1 sugar O-acyltransferase (sialic acid O-acetyltransferase NeuD family) [Chryseobacterium aquifrigidense]
MKRIAIIGSGHLGQQILHHIQTDTDDKVIGFFDDFMEKGNSVKDLPILGGKGDVISIFQQGIFDEIIIAIGYKHLEFKKQIFETFKNKIPFYTFIHSTSYIDPSATIGEGTVIYPYSMIDQNVKIGDNVLINISCSIAHDSLVGNHCFVSPSVAVAGFVSISEQCILGIHSTIIDNINIVEKVQLGGGAVVIKNISQPGLYVGNPVRFIR